MLGTSTLFLITVLEVSHSEFSYILVIHNVICMCLLDFTNTNVMGKISELNRKTEHGSTQPYVSVNPSPKKLLELSKGRS